MMGGLGLLETGGTDGAGASSRSTSSSSMSRVGDVTSSGFVTLYASSTYDAGNHPSWPSLREPSSQPESTCVCSDSSARVMISPSLNVRSSGPSLLYAYLNSRNTY